MAKAIKSIKITGKPPKPETVTIYDASGDRTEMRIKKSSFGSADLTGAFDISNPEALIANWFSAKNEIFYFNTVRFDFCVPANLPGRRSGIRAFALQLICAEGG